MCSEIVFCGRSNVGKSSLINKLCGQNKLARVSSAPGKTTTINFFKTDGDLMLVDLPGYGFAKRSFEEKIRWSELMEHYFNSGRDILLGLVLLDSRHEPTVEDFQMIEVFNTYGIDYWVILTKTDKLNKSELNSLVNVFSEKLNGLGCKNIFPFTTKGEDRVELLRNSLSNIIF